MNFFRNKKIIAFIVGVIILLGLGVTLIALQREQQTQSRAAVETTLFFAPTSSAASPITKQPNETFTLDVMINPGSNAVSFVKMIIVYDSSKFTVSSLTGLSPNTNAFPSTLEGPVYSTGQIAVAYSVGNDPGRAIRTPTKVATLTLTATTPTGGSPTQVAFSTQSQVLSIGTDEQAAEDVLTDRTPAFIQIATPTPTSCAVPLGNFSPGKSTNPCEAMTFRWLPQANSTFYVITIDGVERFRGPGTPNGTMLETVITGLPRKSTGSYTDCFQSGNSCGLSSPSVCGSFNTLTCNPPTPTLTSTPTPPPTGTPVPTSTPVPLSTKFSIVAFLHGVGNSGDNANPNTHTLSNKTPQHPQRPLAVEVYDNTNQNVASATGLITYDVAEGNFKGIIDMGTTLTSGIYTVKIKPDLYLRKLLPGIQTITAGGTATMPTVSLIAGDSNNDNLLNILDYNIILGCYSDLGPAKSCSDTLKLQADLNDDGKVNQFDYNLFLRELSVQTGE